MPDGLPSSTPEIAGNNKGAANTPDNQRKDNPKEKIKPRQRNPKKWLGLTETKWRELLAIVMLIPWVWVDIIDSHNFLKLCLLAISLAVAQGVAFSFFRNRWKGWTLALWLISLVPLAGVVSQNSRPEPKAHLYIGLSNDGPVRNFIWLTNDFLLSKGDSVMFYKGMPWLVVPVLDTDTNISFWLQLVNDSEIDADSPEVRMVIGGIVNCFPDFGWSMARELDRSDLTWRQSAILSKEPQVLPRVLFPPWLPTNNSVLGQIAPISIMVRAKNCPPVIASFLMTLLSESPDLAHASNALRFTVFPSKNVEWGTNEIKFSYPHE